MTNTTNPQGITVALAPAGVEFLIQKMVVGGLVTELGKLVPPVPKLGQYDAFQHRTIITPYSFGTDYFGTKGDTSSSLTIELTYKGIDNYKPQYQSYTPDGKGVFTISMINSKSGSFTVNYNWSEDYYTSVGIPRSKEHHHHHSWTYSPTISNYNVNVQVAFHHDGKGWTFKEQSRSFANAPSVDGSPPGGSFLYKDPNTTVDGCTSSHLKDSTKTAIESIDFTSAIKDIVSNSFGSIPNSGKLGTFTDPDTKTTTEIDYEFALSGQEGDLTFPGTDGSEIAIGADGGAKIIVTHSGGSPTPTTFKSVYQGTLPSLSLPTAPTSQAYGFSASVMDQLNPANHQSSALSQADFNLISGLKWTGFASESALSTQLNSLGVSSDGQNTIVDATQFQPHLRMYVSGYEVDALYWAYFKAGQLKHTVTPADLGISTAKENPLKTAFYKGKGKAGNAIYEAYPDDDMFASISPTEASTTAFKTIYIFSDTAMNTIQHKYPSVYKMLQGVSGLAFLNKGELEKTLKQKGLDATQISNVETIIKTMAAVVTHDLQYTISIGDPGNVKAKDVITFKVSQTDLLQNIRLGASTVTETNKSVQSIGFDLSNYNASETFISSSISGVTKSSFGEFGLWGNVLLPHYIDILEKAGKAGTPLPIMAGFQFDFDQNYTSVQNGFLELVSTVKLK